jgi:hypothetical protein
MSWYSKEEKAESIRRARETLAKLKDILPAQRTTTAANGLVYKDRDNARVEPEPREVLKRSEPVKLESVQPPVVAPNETQVWWQWTQRHVEARLAEFGEELATQMGEAMAEWVGRKVDPIKRDLELTRRELTVLRHEVGVERGLKDLRREVAKAQRQIPQVPAIAAQFDAEQKHLKAKQARLEHELAVTKDKLGKLRVDQSISNYKLGELRKQVDASAGASIEMEFESRSSHFQAAIKGRKPRRLRPRPVTGQSKSSNARPLRKPALDLSDVVRQPCTVITGASQ